MELAPDSEVQQSQDLVRELFEHVLYDEEPIFISDQATIWDVSMSTSEELLSRIARYYGVEISRADLNQPLWTLLREISSQRK
jgi:hypothetical protein